MTLAVDNHLSEDGCVRGSAGSTTDPPLGSTQVGSVDDEFIGGMIEGSYGLEARNVRAMGQFGHGEATDDTVEAKDAFVNPVAYDEFQ